MVLGIQYIIWGVFVNETLLSLIPRPRGVHLFVLDVEVSTYVDATIS